MAEEIDSRVLTKTISGCAAVVNDPAGTLSSFTGGEGWRSVLSGAYWVIYNIQSFDLSGYTLQMKTLFPQGVLMQDMSQGATSNLSTSAQRATIVSTTPISEADLTNFDGSTGVWHLPGSNESTHTLDNIIQGRYQFYLTLTTFAGLQQVRQTSWGSGDSTAADKMWVCDAWVIPNIAGSQLTTPDQSFVIPTLIDKEAELEYLMRLSRSLEPVY